MAIDDISSNNLNLTLEELIRSELHGKDLAIERYDSILWKIRSGYVAVLYGALSLFGKEVLSLPLLTLALICGFSLCAFIIDYSFLRSKVQVVVAKDKLADIALQFVSKAEDAQFKDLSYLLHNSGEDPTFRFESDVHRILWNWNGAGRVLILYVVTPIVGAIVSLILAF